MCEKSIDELKTTVGSVIGYVTSKKKKKPKKKKNKGSKVAIDEDYIGGRKSFLKKREQKRKEV